MKIIQIILQKTTASKLWLSMVVVSIALLNVSAVEAKSLQKGEEFKQKNGWGIRVISSNEVEVDGQGNNIFIGKYTVDGERVRIVISGLGTAMVVYYKIAPDGLVAEKDGTVYYSKAGLAAKINAEESRKAAVFAARFAINGDEVTDKKTGLIWRRCAELMVYNGGTCTGTSGKGNYEAALQRAKSEASRTGKAWRVPEKDELASIVDQSHSNPAIDHTAFPATPSVAFWSASPVVDYPHNAWVVYFGSDYNPYGNSPYGGDRNDSFYVRLVRGGQNAGGKGANERADENANTVPQSNAIAASKYPNKGKVLEAMDAAIYTYMQVTSDKGPIWIASSNKTSVPKGATISYPNGAAMTNFFSKALNRTFDTIIFVDKIEVLK